MSLLDWLLPPAEDEARRRAADRVYYCGACGRYNRGGACIGDHPSSGPTGWRRWLS